jgi:hypothetical protein
MLVVKEGKCKLTLCSLLLVEFVQALPFTLVIISSYDPDASSELEGLFAFI